MICKCQVLLEKKKKNKMNIVFLQKGFLEHNFMLYLEIDFITVYTGGLISPRGCRLHPIICGCRLHPIICGLVLKWFIRYY